MDPNNKTLLPTVNPDSFHNGEKSTTIITAAADDAPALKNTAFQRLQRQHGQPTMSRRPWLLLSLPMAVALIVSTSVYCLSTTTTSLPSFLHQDNLGPRPSPSFFPAPPSSAATTSQGLSPWQLDWLSAIFGSDIPLASSSWPTIPIKNRDSSQTFSDLTSGAAPCQLEQETASVMKDVEDADDDEDEDEDEYCEEDEENEEDEEEEEETLAREWDAILHIPGGEIARVGSDLEADEITDFIQEIEEKMLATVPRGMESENVIVLDLSPSSPMATVVDDMLNSIDITEWGNEEVTVLNLSRRDHRHKEEKKEGGDKKRQRKKGHDLSIASDDDIEADDEDEHDHFPSNLKNNKDDTENEKEASGENEDEDDHKHHHHKNEDKGKDDDQESDDHHPRKHHHRHRLHHQQPQDQNANLGSTGANGPILLCSSRSCLPSLRDSILSRLSTQIQHVMNHLRHRDTLFHGMESTAPQTKESLIAAQEETVQQLEDRIVKDLKDWVMGINRKSRPSSSSSTDTKDKEMKIKTASIGDGQHETVAEMSVESEGFFLGGEDFETEGVISSASSSGNGFRMAGLSLEKANDDHVDEPTLQQNQKKEQKQKNQKNRHHFDRRDEEKGQQGQNDLFLSADKVLMKQEWSRWIAHWVHHAKLLILSHSLATRTLQEMNQIAISGENVVSVDQRHWSWNLDKALATVMVAAEMLCGGPASAPAGPVGVLKASSKEDAATLKAMALTLNAQKCIDFWSPDLETILQHTATKA